MPDPDDRAAPPDQPETPDFEPVEIKRKKMSGMTMMVVGLGAVGAAAAAYFVYGEALQGPKSDKVPVIRADVNPVKERPETPGGMEIANRDKKIYDRVEGTGVQPTVERLLPEPEQPEPLPSAPEPSQETAALPDVPEADMAESLTPPESPEPPAAPEGAPLPLQPSAEADQTATIEPTPEAAPKTDIETPAAASAVETPEPPAPPKAEPGTTEPEPAQRVAALTPPKAQGGNEPFFRVQVAAVRDDKAAVRAFADAQKKHGDLFADKSLYVQKADLGAEKGIYYRVRIGPYADKAEADQICSVLKARGGGCLVVRPGK